MIVCGMWQDGEPFLSWHLTPVERPKVTLVNFMADSHKVGEYEVFTMKEYSPCTARAVLIDRSGLEIDIIITEISVENDDDKNDPKLWNCFTARWPTGGSVVAAQHTDDWEKLWV